MTLEKLAADMISTGPACHRAVKSRIHTQVYLQSTTAIFCIIHVRTSYYFIYHVIRKFLFQTVSYYGMPYLDYAQLSNNSLLVT